MKRFCANCNSGWMSNLERETIPILEPMILFEDFRRTIGLSPRDQAILARWAYKTTLVLDFAFPDQPTWIPTSWYADFYRRRWPPNRGVVIWVTTYGDFNELFIPTRAPQRSSRKGQTVQEWIP